jgi:hypothetical protein
MLTGIAGLVTYSLTHSLTHSLTQSLTHSLTHSLTQVLAITIASIASYYTCTFRYQSNNLHKEFQAKTTEELKSICLANGIKRSGAKYEITAAILAHVQG